MGVPDYTINDDLTVDVAGHVDLDKMKLKYLPVQFGTVNGFFAVMENQLTSLKGCPHTANDLYASNNNLINLDYHPTHINDKFSFHTNGIDHGNIVKLLFLDMKFVGRASMDVKYYRAERIINKHLASKDILSCVDELLEAGYAELCHGI